MYYCYIYWWLKSSIFVNAVYKNLILDSINWTALHHSAIISLSDQTPKQESGAHYQTITMIVGATDYSDLESGHVFD